MVTLGRRKLVLNNVLVLEINKIGILVDKQFFDKEKMNEINFVDKKTGVIVSKESFVYEFLSTLRRKINDPLGTKKIKWFYPATTASNNKATILVILIIGLTAGPAVSLYGSPTVSPVTAALWASDPFPP